MNTLSEYCLPLVRVGGLFVAQKGRSYNEEIDKALKIVQFLGGELIGVEKCSNSLYKSRKTSFNNQENKSDSF